MQPATTYKQYLVQMQSFLASNKSGVEQSLNDNHAGVENIIRDALSSLSQLHNLLEGRLEKTFGEVALGANYNTARPSGPNGNQPLSTGYEKLMDGINQLINDNNTEDFELGIEKNKNKTELVYEFANKMKNTMIPQPSSGGGLKPKEEPWYKAAPRPAGM